MQKPIVTRILLDPNGPPFMKITGGKMTTTFSGINGQYSKPQQDARMNQVITYENHPHEMPLELHERPNVKIKGNNNYLMFLEKVDGKIKIKFFIDDDSFSAEESVPVFETEVASDSLVKIGLAMMKTDQKKLGQVLKKVAGNINHRTFKKFSDQHQNNTFQAKCRHLTRAIGSMVKPNKFFLGALIEAIEGITMHDHLDLIQKSGLKVSGVDIDTDGAKTKYTH